MYTECLCIFHICVHCTVHVFFWHKNLTDDTVKEEEKKRISIIWQLATMTWCSSFVMIKLVYIHLIFTHTINLYGLFIKSRHNVYIIIIIIIISIQWYKHKFYVFVCERPYFQRFYFDSMAYELITLSQS